MRIRFVTLYFPPEVGAAQRRISELTCRLAHLGHQVTVLTGFPNYPSGIKPPEYRRKLFMKERKEDYTIIRVPHYVAPNKGFLKRLMIHLTFAFSASVYSLFMKRDDVVYVESPPLFNGFVGLTSKWGRHIPYFFNVADPWPQTAIELGALSNKWLIAFSRFLEKTFYRYAERILAVTVGDKLAIEEIGFASEKVPLITNGVDHILFNDVVEPDKEIFQYRQPNRLLALYAGTHGMAQSLATILKAADRLRDESIDFLFIGDGAEKEMLQDMAEKLKLSHLTFLPPLPQSRMPNVLRAVDIAIISLRDIKLFETTMPSKCFEAMAAGLPIMLAVRGEMAGHISKAGCGLVAQPENVEDVVRAFHQFIAMSETARKEMGRRGRTYVVDNFSREKLTAKLESMMQETVSRG